MDMEAHIMPPHLLLQGCNPEPSLCITPKSKLSTTPHRPWAAHGPSLPSGHSLKARSHRDAEQQAQHPQPAKDDGEDHADDDAIGRCGAGGVALLAHVRRAVVARERVCDMPHVMCNGHWPLASAVQQSLIKWRT